MYHVRSQWSAMCTSVGEHLLLQTVYIYIYAAWWVSGVQPIFFLSIFSYKIFTLVFLALMLLGEWK